MKIFEEVLEYLNQDCCFRRMDDYTDDEGVLYKVAFFFLTLVLTIVICILYALLFITTPIWIVPYLIYRTKKEKRGGRQ